MVQPENCTDEAARYEVITLNLQLVVASFFYHTSNRLSLQYPWLLIIFDISLIDLTQLKPTNN